MTAKPSVFQRAQAEGLNARGMSAKDLRQSDPAMAERFARFIDDHRAELIAEVAKRVTR